MKVTWSAVVTGFAAISAVNAHFQVTFPAVRGDFSEDNETQFCGGYTQPANRTRFPLASGFILWETLHSESWTVGVMVSTASSPTSFNDFRTASGADQLVVGYFQGSGSPGCVHIEPTAARIPGIQNGTDVTFQMVFEGGDGILYQCMDVILDDQYRIPPDIRCMNPQGQPPSNDTSTLPSTAGSGSPSSTRSGSPSSTRSGSPNSTSGIPSPTSTVGSSSSGGATSTGVSRLLGLGLAGVVVTIFI